MDWESFLEFVAPGLNPPYQGNVEANGAPPPAVQNNMPEQAAAHNGPNLNAIPQAPVAPAAAINNVYNFNAPVQLGFQGLGEPMPLHVNVPGGYVNGGNVNGGHLGPVDGNVVNHNNHFNGGNVQNNQFNGNNHHNNEFGGNNLAVHAPPPAPAPPLALVIQICDHPGCNNPVEDPGPRVRKCLQHLLSRIGPGRRARMDACRAMGLIPCRGCTSGRPQRAPGQSCWRCEHIRQNRRPGGCPGCLHEGCPRFPGQYFP